jgi:hypothetical protein
MVAPLLQRARRVPVSALAALAAREAGGKATAAVERDYTFLTAAVARRRELGKRYEMDKDDERSNMDRAKAVAKRVGLAIPEAPTAPKSGK